MAGIDTTTITAKDGGNLTIKEEGGLDVITIVDGQTGPQMEGAVKIKESAAAPDDTAAYGQLWVKNDSPNNLYFVNDDGAEVQITNGSSLAGVAGSLSGLGSTDNVVLRTNGTGGETAQGSGVVIDDSNNISGVGTLACGAITSTADTATFTSANADDPLVVIKNTASDATGARLQFVKDKGAAGADGDDIGVIEFVGDDAGQTQTTFAKIVAEVSEADDSDEAGKLSLFVAESDGTTTTLTAGLVLEGEHATDGEVDVTIGAGSASTTTVAGSAVITTDLSVDGTSNLDNTDIDGTLVVDGSNISLDSTSTLNIDCSNTSNGITIGTATSAVPISIGHTTSEVTINDNLTVTGDLSGPTDGDFLIKSDGNMTFKIDADNDESSQSFAFQNNASTEIANLSEAGTLQLDGDLNVDGGDLIFGNGQHATIDVADVSGTDTAGKNLTLLAGAGTGTGEGGSIVFKTSKEGGSSNSSVNAHATALEITRKGDSVFSGDIEVTSAGSNGPSITIQNTHDGANAGSLQFKKILSGQGDDNDKIGTISFHALDDGNNEEVYASIEVLNTDETHTTEDASMLFNVMTGGTSKSALSIEATIDQSTFLTDLAVENKATSSSSEGGKLRLMTNDGADATASGHQLGIITFEGARDTSNNMMVGAQIEAFADATFGGSERGSDLVFSTADANTMTEGMRLVAEGRLGIGTNAPGALVHATGANDEAVPTLKVTHQDVDVTAIDLDLSNTTSIGIDIDAANTTGNIIDILSDDALTTGKVLHVDINNGTTSALTPVYNHFDFDKDGVTGDGVTQTFTMFDIDMNDGATNHANSNVTMTGMTVDVVSANAQGTLKNKGLVINCSGADKNEGLHITADTHITMFSSADANDFVEFEVKDDGEFKIKTTDSTANAKANIVLAPDGELIFETAAANAAGTNQWDAAGGLSSFVSKVNSVIESTFILDLGAAGVSASGTAGNVIAEGTSVQGSFTKITKEVNGIIYKVEMACFEDMAGSNITKDIDLFGNTGHINSGSDVTSGTNIQIINSDGNFGVGQRRETASGTTLTDGLDDYYLYIAEGNSAHSGGGYSAGKLLVKLYGLPV